MDKLAIMLLALESKLFIFFKKINNFKEPVKGTNEQFYFVFYFFIFSIAN